MYPFYIRLAIFEFEEWFYEYPWIWILLVAECWYLRISIDFPLRFSISVSLIWSSCSPLSIQWCFYLHWHPYFLHLSTQSTRLLSSTLCFSSALVLLTFSRWRWRFLSFCLVVENLALTLDLVLPWSLRTLSHFSSWQQRHASYVSSVLCVVTLCFNILSHSI